MDKKLKIAGVVFLVALALGAAWALWLGLKALAWIAGAGLVIGLAAGGALGLRSRRKLPPPDDHPQLG
ncbi:hypothetical protein [Phenylobacterium sp.]|uniref:hypothetical protein n=1 Tax=Phenylobacterium sp. TaxID=1871053 RepID=UPI00301E3BDE